LVDLIQAEIASDKELDVARKELRENLVATAPIFTEKPYFMSDEFTIVDCCVLPILWRLPELGIKLPETKATKALIDYRERLFERESVQESLSEQEKEMAIG
jgi:RNA polymerase-associated protein